MTPIPFFLVTGFLGSGKTTFLKGILKKYASEKKVAIIQNEFAPANVDGAELKKEGGAFEILEINNGSVFCVCLLSNFTSSLKAFVEEHNPDMIFLEASGLSDPIAIAQLLDFEDLKKNMYLAKVWTIVDAANFLKQQALLKTVQHQVRIADVVIINKTDLSSNEQVEEVVKVVGSLNPFTKIIRSSYCDITDQELAIEDIHETVSEKTQDQNARLESGGRPEIGVGVFRSSRGISREKLIQFIDIYSKKTIRIKGFAKLANGGGLAVQTSYKYQEFKDVEDFRGSTELIIMGDGFNLSEFNRNYKEFSR